MLEKRIQYNTPRNLGSWKAGFSVILRKKKLESIEDYRAFDRALWKVME